MVRFTLILSEPALDALCAFADREHTQTRDAAVKLITAGLQQRGLLEKENDLSGRAEVADPSRAGDGVDQIISASAYPSTDGGRHALG